MELSDLIPWNRQRSPVARRREEEPLWSLHREMNRVFEDFARGFDLAPWAGSSGDVWSFDPSLDVSETDEEIRVTADLPGLEEKDIELNVSNGMLTLRGEKRAEREDRKGEVSHRLERTYGAFRRTIPLPCEVDVDKAEAKFKRGVLSVTLPKTASAKSNVRHIDVKAD